MTKAKNRPDSWFCSEKKRDKNEESPLNIRFYRRTALFWNICLAFQIHFRLVGSLKLS